MDGDALRVVHASPGRVRLKAARLKGDAAFAQQAAARLRQVPGIRQVEANPLTGSLLIHYSLPELMAPAGLLALQEGVTDLFPDLEPQALIQGLQSLTTAAPHAAGTLTGTLAALNARVAALTGGVDLGLLIPLLFLGLGVRSLLAGDKLPMPRWYDYFWFAFSTFMMLKGGRVQEPA